MNRYAGLALLLVICLVEPDLFGQELLFNFSQGRDTYIWSDSLLWEPEFGGRKPLLFSNTSSAVLIKKSILLEKKDRWQESYRSDIKWRFRAGHKLDVKAVFGNDYRSFEERVVVENSIGLAVDYRPVTGMVLSDIGSFIANSRSNYGSSYRSSGYRNQLQATYDRSFSSATGLRVEYDQDLKIIPDIPVSSLEGKTSFHSLGSSDSITVSVEGAYQNSRYFTTSQSFESISRQRKSTAGADLLVSWRPILGTHLRLVSNLDMRQYEYQHYGSDRVGFASGLLGSDNSSRTTDYRLSVIRQVARLAAFETHYMFREIREKYGSVSVEQKAETGELHFAVKSSPGLIDSAWAEAIFSVTGYSSDQERSRFSDRDRIMRLYGLGFMQHLRPWLVLRIDGSYRDFHQTYISGALSANNNHNAIYVLRPEVRWRPFPWFEISNDFLLHANYIWYDYEKESGSERNTLFRRARWISEYCVLLSRRLTLRPSYTYKYEDFGQLLWKDGQWVQRTNWYRRAHLPSLDLSYRPFRSLRIDPGMSYEWKKSWEFTVGEGGLIDRVDKETFRRTSMHVDVEYSSGPRTSITVSYQRRVQKSDLFADDITNQYIVSVYRLF
jgi:hypothetical protein